MARLNVLSSHGDTQVLWDAKKAAEGDREAIAAVREAERIFGEERAKGSTAFRVAPDMPAERIEAFDQTAEQIIMVPKVAGGAWS